MKIESNVKNIIFDLGGVILNIDYQLTENAFKSLGFRDFRSVYSKINQEKLFNALEVGKISESEFVAEIQKYLPKVSPQQIINAWNAMLLDLPKERIELLNILKTKYRIFLLSNTNEIHVRKFQEIIKHQFGSDVLTPLFENTYYSNEIGLRKPNKECFEFVLNDNGLKAVETLFIDDSIQHVKGAKACGINSYLLNVKKQNILSIFPDTIL